MNPQVDDFFDRITQWRPELEYLRKILLDCGLTETYKWKVPCYTFNNSNIAIIHGFKSYCALNFFKGALLKDDTGLLVQQTENVQEARQLRFTDTQQIAAQEAIIKAYLFEAIEIEKAGLKVTPKKTEDFNVPVELQEKFNSSPAFEKAFHSLTPGRQRGYLIFFGAAKQAKTRASRIDNNMDRILKGYGLNDCICGKSKRMPNCDGSHKNKV